MRLRESLDTDKKRRKEKGSLRIELRHFKIQRSDRGEETAKETKKEQPMRKEEKQESVEFPEAK